MIRYSTAVVNAGCMVVQFQKSDTTSTPRTTRATTHGYSDLHIAVTLVWHVVRSMHTAAEACELHSWAADPGVAKL